MSGAPPFAEWFDAACAARWRTNTEAAAAIAHGLRHAGLSRTGRVQIGRWRTGRTAPSLAVQRELARYLARHWPLPKGACDIPGQALLFPVA